MPHAHRLHARMALVMLIVGVTSTLTEPAHAIAPRIEHVDDSFTFTLNVCSFRIEAIARTTGTATLFLDERGNILRTLLHLYSFAVWTNPRSGKSVIERDHTFAVVRPDVSSLVTGLNFHLSLPDGRTILVDAGRIGYDADQNIVFEAGRHPIEDGDVAALCAAMR